MELDAICLAVRKMQLMGASTLQELKQEAEQLFEVPSGQVRGCSTDARDHSAWCMQVTAVIWDDDEDRGTEICSDKHVRKLESNDRSVRFVNLNGIAEAAVVSPGLCSEWQLQRQQRVQRGMMQNCRTVRYHQCCMSVESTHCGHS